MRDMAEERASADPGRPIDTSIDAHAHQREVYLRIGGAARLAIAFDLSEMVRNTTMAGIRARHPEYRDEDVQRAWARLTLGDALCREVWPDQPLIDP